MADDFADLPERYRTMPSGDLLQTVNGTPSTTTLLWFGLAAIAVYVVARKVTR